MSSYLMHYSAEEIEQILDNAQEDHLKVAELKEQVTFLEALIRDFKTSIQHQIYTLILQNGGTYTLGDYTGYLGVLNSTDNLPNDPTVPILRGQYFTAGANLTDPNNTIYEGDTILAMKDNPVAQIDGVNWKVLHNNNSFNMVSCTQDEYDSMQSHDGNTVYLILPEVNN